MRGFVACLLAVLAAIGIGVGVEAALAPVAYGPPGDRFVAAFPAPPRTFDLRVGRATVRLYASRTGSGRYSVEIVTPGTGVPAQALARVASAICPDPGSCGGWVGYAPLSASPGQPAVDVGGIHARVFGAWGISNSRRVFVAGATAPSRAAWWSIAAIGPKAAVEGFMQSVAAVA